jgi:uncharacterized Zn-binding protein involved in type VI secretion
MPEAAYVTTGLSHGGSVIEGSPNVYVNGKAIARLGDAASCSLHGLTQISSASSTTTANGLPVARLGDSCACGAILVAPVSPNVLIQ